MDIAVPEDNLSKAVGRGGQNVRLACELTGFNINVLSEEEFNTKLDAENEEIEAGLAKVLDVDDDIAVALMDAGYNTAEDVAYAEREDLLSIEAFDESLVDQLIEHAADYLLTQAFVIDPDEEMQTAIEEMGLDEALADKLLQAGLQTQEDVAELAVDELMGIANVEKEVASAIILQAREPWFRQA